MKYINVEKKEYNNQGEKVESTIKLDGATFKWFYDKNNPFHVYGIEVWYERKDGIIETLNIYPDNKLTDLK